MAIGISIDTARALRKIKNIGKHFDDATYLEVVGLSGLNWINKNFREEGTEKKWKPLAESTKAARRKGKGKSGRIRILRDTGRMAQSFKMTIGLDKKSVSVQPNTGTEDKKAVTHEKGIGRIPQRKILPTQRTADRLAVKVLDAYVKRILR